MEKLYNNIILPDNFADKINDFKNTPYLKNPPDVINVSVGRQLFVDDFLIEETELQPEYHKPEKYAGNPILKAEKYWEMKPLPVAAPKSGGVWYDEEDKKFKMWYEAGWLGKLCYAESEDGINWIRPNLGIVEGTNIIIDCRDENDEIIKGMELYRADSSTFWIDYNCPKEEKYKFFSRAPGRKFPGITGVSADGIHFEKIRETGNVYDRSTLFYNPFRKKWVNSIRDKWDGDGEENEIRSRSYREFDNFIEEAAWKDGEEHRWMCCDELDKPNPYLMFKPELYNVDCIGYESLMIGMAQVLYGPVGQHCEDYGIPKITEIMPMYSRDGYNYTRPCREAFVNASMAKGTWDRGYIESVSGGIIINDDELYIYYIGFAGDEKFAGQTGNYRNGATGLAKLRRDGFVSMNGKGMLLTRKIEFKDKYKLYVNVIGSISAEILDENGDVIGKSQTFSGDSTKAELVFDGVSIRNLNEKVLRLRFNVDGKLFAFGFADENDDFGGAHAAGIVSK